MQRPTDEEWLQGRTSLAAAARWTPEEIQVIAELGYALAELGRNEEALTIFAGLAALSPTTAYFQAALGALRLRTGDPAQALTHLDRALAVRAEDLTALVNRGEACLNLGDNKAALSNLRAALRLSASQPEEKLAVTRARALLNIFSVEETFPSEDR